MRLALPAWMLAAMALAGPAQAAFAPTLAVRLDPPIAGQVPQVAATVTQAPGEAAAKRFTLRFPPGFVVNRARDVQDCTGPSLAARDCPPASRIGRLGSVPLYLTDSGTPALIQGFVPGGGVLDGTFKQGIGGTLDISLDGLPLVALDRLELVLDGGDYGLVRTPSDCGTWNVNGAFTSWLGDLAIAETPLSITQCAAEPVVISALGLTARSFRAARSDTDALRPGVGTRVRWRLSRATSATRISIDRSTAAGWKRVGSVIGAGDRGQNVLVFDGRLRGRRLGAGVYRFVVLARGGSSAAGVRFTIVR